LARNYYDGWQTADAKCAECNWQGKLGDANHEAFAELMEVNCPKCFARLELVMFPTVEEAAAASPMLGAAEREFNSLIAEFRTRFESMKLKEASELPDIPDATIVLVWDHVTTERGDLVEIRHGPSVIWSEPPVYEGFERFEEVVEILQEKCGARLYDVVPTKGSYVYLLGDSLSADVSIEHCRKRLRESALT
jgi:hypothetical protein